MKTILIPIDFSALSQSTAHFGIELAHCLHARVVLLHVVQLAPPVPTFNIPIVAELTTWNDSLHAQMAQALQQFQHTLGEHQQQHGFGDVPVSSQLVVGQPADSILEVALTEQASFVVMGTVGASNAWDKLLGSVTSVVVQRATCPIWVLPNAVKLSMLHQFAYFADLKGLELTCINKVMNIGERLGAALAVVHISASDDDEFMAAETIIDAFEDQFASERITFRHLSYESVADGIDAYVRSHWPDAVVLAHRDRGFVEKLFHASLIRKLSLTTRRPLLVVPKKG